MGFLTRTRQVLSGGSYVPPPPQYEALFPEDAAPNGSTSSSAPINGTSAPVGDLGASAASTCQLQPQPVHHVLQNRIRANYNHLNIRFYPDPTTSGVTRFEDIDTGSPLYHVENNPDGIILRRPPQKKATVEGAAPSSSLGQKVGAGTRTKGRHFTLQLGDTPAAATCVLQPSGSSSNQTYQLVLPASSTHKNTLNLKFVKTLSNGQVVMPKPGDFTTGWHHFKIIETTSRWAVALWLQPDQLLRAGGGGGGTIHFKLVKGDASILDQQDIEWLLLAMASLSEMPPTPRPLKRPVRVDMVNDVLHSTGSW